MSEKKYTIVKVQKKCPYYEVISKKCLLDFEDCRKECINIKGKFQYGDTKEQMVRKIAQVIAKCRLEKEMNGIMYSWGDEARKIVEFLGVEE